MKKWVCLLVLMMFYSGVMYAETTLWLIGDSTVASYPDEKKPLAGWGQMLPEFCAPGVKVDNRAVSGRSCKSFIDEGRWDKILPLMKSGDYLLIQFGHNDQKKEDKTRYADPEVAYPELLTRFITEAQERGVTPILVTSVCRRQFKDGKLVHTLGGYPDAMRKLAKTKGIALIDLNTISYDNINALGETNSIKLFNHIGENEYPNWKAQKDDTHFNQTGANTIALWVVNNAKSQKLPLAACFK